MRWLAIAALMGAAAPATAQTLIVGNKGEDTVSFVDLASGRELARRATGRMPHEIAISPDGRRAAVVAYGGGSIDIFDVTRMLRTQTIDLRGNRAPHGLVWLADNRLVATTEGSDTVTIVAVDGAGAARVRAVPTGQQGSHLVAVRDATTAYVANMKSGTVGIVALDGRTPPVDLPAGAEPEGIALSPDGTRLWAADSKGDTVRVFDTATRAELARLPTGRMPIRIAVTADGTKAYVSNAGGGTLSVYDARALVSAGTVAVSGKPAAMQVTILLSADGKRLYAAETGTDTVAEVDLAAGKVLRRLPAGRQGDGLAISPRTVAR